MVFLEKLNPVLIKDPFHTSATNPRLIPINTPLFVDCLNGTYKID